MDYTLAPSKSGFELCIKTLPSNRLQLSRTKIEITFKVILWDKKFFECQWSLACQMDRFQLKFDLHLREGQNS